MENIIKNETQVSEEAMIKYLKEKDKIQRRQELFDRYMEPLFRFIIGLIIL